MNCLLIKPKHCALVFFKLGSFTLMGKDNRRTKYRKIMPPPDEIKFSLLMDQMNKWQNITA